MNNRKLPSESYRTLLLLLQVCWFLNEFESTTYELILVGRMIDHLHNAQSFSLENVDILILDEADRLVKNDIFCPIIYTDIPTFSFTINRLLDMGFTAAVEEIIKFCPKGRQTMLFSATMTEEVCSSPLFKNSQLSYLTYFYY